MTEQKLIFPFMGPIYDLLGEIAPAILRAAAGLFLMPHGAQKLFGWFGGPGLEGTSAYFQSALELSNGYPAAVAAGSVEFFGGLALALGLFTRISAGAVIVLLLVALSTHVSSGFFVFNGGYEYALLWTIVAALFWVKGGGRYSFDALIGREF